MTTRIRIMLSSIVVVLLLAACQAASAATSAPVAVTGGNGGNNRQFGSGNFGAGGGGFSGTPLSPAQRATRIALRQTQGLTGGGFGFGASTPTPTPAPTDPPTPTPTVVTASDQAVNTVRAYFGDLQTGNFTAAAGLTSNLSRFAFKLTNASVASALSQQAQQGAAWSNLQVQGTQTFNDSTILVHVTYQLAEKDAKTGQITQSAMDELWPVVLENGQWLYNWNNIIDFNTLVIPYQEVNGLTVTPLQITRYPDHLTLTLMAQNATNDPIVIGSTNQVLATFHFGSQTVDAINTQYVIDRLRGYSNIDISVKGLFTSYPTSVDLIHYKNSQTLPWFTFNLGN